MGPYDFVSELDPDVGIQRQEYVDPRSELDESTLGILFDVMSHAGIGYDPTGNETGDLAEHDLFTAHVDYGCGPFVVFGRFRVPSHQKQSVVVAEIVDSTCYGEPVDMDIPY